MNSPDDFSPFLAGFELLYGPQPLALIFAFIWGGLWGSFLNVVILRLPLMRSVVFPPSACGSCGEPLSALENVPILSCLFQGAKCRRCGATFSWRYMLVELWMASWSCWLVLHDRGMGWLWIFHVALVFVATAVFLTDLDHWIIPDEVNLGGVVMGIIFSLELEPRHDLDGLTGFLGWHLTGNFWSSVVGAIFGWLFFSAVQWFGLIVAKQEAMGGGDVKYAAALGAFLGWSAGLQAFLLSFLLGALMVIPMIILRRSGKEPIPFGTFMSVAAVLVALWGQLLVSWFESGMYRFNTLWSGSMGL